MIYVTQCRANITIFITIVIVLVVTALTDNRTATVTGGVGIVVKPVIYRYLLHYFNPFI